MQLWPDVRFDDDEYATRQSRLRDTVCEAGLDALLVSDERTTWYLTGFGGHEPIGSTARPRVALIGPSGPLAFFVHESTARCVTEMVSPEVEVRPYGELGAPVAELAAALAERAAAAVGADLGGGLQPRLGVADVRALERVSGSELQDASALIWEQRSAKSRAEAERIGRACTITTEAYELAFAGIRRGMTEAAVARAMSAALVRCGADGAWSNCVAGLSEYDRVDGVPRERVIEPGELVFIDAGGSVGGYWADFSRAGVLGGPSAHQEEQQDRVRRVTRAGVEAVRPGLRMSEVAATLDQAMAAEEIPFNNRPGRYGHSLGMTVTEPPDVSGQELSVLAPGMVITIEPATVDEAGIYHCEEDVLVTSRGCEVLSKSESHLRALG